ncbi:hypothetical protein A4G23_05161 [Streptomyces rubrolavendulae]|uniref:Uncharacterized protein n=1 Tax=Streptomyces rubrolavendulae TaxID=285473 RepID=A0A1D8G9Y2_9ACTN|nr:hypothetical protein A4G23_05161 [Streptomyces rubrolavendulae]
MPGYRRNVFSVRDGTKPVKGYAKSYSSVPFRVRMGGAVRMDVPIADERRERDERASHPW